MQIKKIEGLIAATFSSFDKKGQLNLDLIPLLVEKLFLDGVKGVFICGTNGEGPNMTTKERMAVAEAYINACKGKLLVFVHVGHNSIEESRELAAHAEYCGADAISSVAGFYFKPVSVENLVDCMAAIAAAAPATPFYYYHIPVLTGVAMDMVRFLQLAETRIPNLAGIKYTAATLHEYQSCLNYAGSKYDILFGYDEMLLPALTLGAKGAVGSTYTFAAPLYRQVMENFSNGELVKASELHYRLVQMVRCLLKFSTIPAQKAIMKTLGLDMGPCRLPLNRLSDEEFAILYDDLNSIHFFELLDKKITQTY